VLAVLYLSPRFAGLLKWMLHQAGIDQASGERCSTAR
jgi:hypothetical protein